MYYTSICKQLCKQNKCKNQANDQYIFDTAAMIMLLNDKLQNAGVDIRYYTQLIGAEKEVTNVVPVIPD